MTALKRPFLPFLVNIFARLHINAGLNSNPDRNTFHSTDSTISTKSHNFDQISQFRPSLAILTKFHDFNQISQFPPNFTISTKFLNFD